VGFCSSDSARGRFDEPASDEVLTGGVPAPFEGRAPSFVKGFSEGAGDDWVEGRMVILGFGAGSELMEAAGVEDWEDEAGGVPFPPEACPPDFGGPASFSIRRRRIWSSR
jgi:hypothetical protein